MAFTGKKIPGIEVNATNSTGETFKINVLKEAFRNDRKVLLFWYPKDFTALSAAELHAFQETLEEFEKRNTTVIAASCDTPEAHAAWLRTKKSQGGIEGITYNLLADSNRNLANILGILDIDNVRMDKRSGATLRDGENVSYRATYLIDEEGIVIHEGVNHMQLGRNVRDYLRLIDDYNRFRKNGELRQVIEVEEGKVNPDTNRQGAAA